MSSFRELQHTFAAGEPSAWFKLEPGETADYNVAGTFTGRVDLEQSDSPGTHVETLIQGTANAGTSGTLINDKGDARWYRFHAQSWTGGPLSRNYGRHSAKECRRLAARIASVWCEGPWSFL